MLRLLFKTLDVGANDCHAARTSLRGPAQTTLHTHDFPEIFYVTAGVGTHHVNGTAQALAAGDICLVRPADSHGYCCPMGGSLDFINVAFAAAWWRRFLRVLPAQAAIARFLAQTLPPHVHVTGSPRGEIRSRFEALLGGGESALRQMEVCTAMMRLLLQEPAAADDLARPPAWLRTVVTQLREPEFSTLGVAGIYRAAGRSPEHVARTCKKFLAATPTDLINAARIERVKRQLLTGDEKISTLAWENGFENLGYFYRVFRRVAGCPPRQWRREHDPARVVPP